MIAIALAYDFEHRLWWAFAAISLILVPIEESAIKLAYRSVGVALGSLMSLTALHFGGLNELWAIPIAMG